MARKSDRQIEHLLRRAGFGARPDELDTYRIRRSGVDVLRALATMPPGNVLSSAEFGNYVPAYTHHRVYVGHWFLTPDFVQRAQEALAAVSGRVSAEQLGALVDAQRIRYLVVPAQNAASFASALGARVTRTTPVGEFAILVLEPAPTPSR